LKRIPRSFSVPLSFSLAIAIASALPLAARGQGHEPVNVRVNVPDSIAHIVDRERPANARIAIVSRDGTAALLLMDTTIVAQMTDAGLSRMNSREATDTIKSASTRLFARMALGALQPLFDHGVAYHLRDLVDARYADGRLQLIRKNGEEVFRDTEINNQPLMTSFSADDARRFAARVREARARLR
jgi:hypothetical protein